LGSVILYAPTDGKVILTATAVVEIYGDDSLLYFGLGTTAGAFDLHSTIVGVIGGSGSTANVFSATSIAIIPVTTGKQTFYVSAVRSPLWDVNLINLDDIYLTAVFCES
jgi:hypothetical protein